eukprot:1022-Heterococcus_DN1.PRE.5
MYNKHAHRGAVDASDMTALTAVVSDVGADVRASLTCAVYAHTGRLMEFASGWWHSIIHRLSASARSSVQAAFELPLIEYYKSDTAGACNAVGSTCVSARTIKLPV